MHTSKTVLLTPHGHQTDILSNPQGAVLRGEAKATSVLRKWDHTAVSNHRQDRELPSRVSTRH